MNEIASPQTSFLLGDRWCYYKFYCGPKTGDQLLIDGLSPLAEEWVAKGSIDGWFFIRYNDPNGHLRWRLQVKEPQALGQIISSVQAALTPWSDLRLVWKVQTDTYQREIERYGRDTMELAEAFFYHDSRMVSRLISLLDGDEGERVRWLMALRASDRLLDDFSLNLDEKAAMIGDFRDGYGREFGMNKALKQHLESKYRKDKKEIERVLYADSQNEDEYSPYYQAIRSRSQALAPIAAEIRRLTGRPESDVDLKSLLGSFLHMMNNRIFRTRQRLHELVLYDYLSLYYRSLLARRKKS